MSVFRFTRVPGLDRYNVLCDGVEIGQVYKWERRYNLRRVIVSRGWRARTPGGSTLSPNNPDGCYNTRADAAGALAIWDAA